MNEGPFGPATFWLEAIRHEMAALVGLVSEVASRDLTPVVHVESGGSDSTPALMTPPIDLQPLIDAVRDAPAPVAQDLSPLLEKLDEIAHVSRGLGSIKGGGGPSFITAQIRNEPGQPVQVTSMDKDVDTRYEWQSVSGTSAPLYIGTAPPSSATSDVTWSVQKFTYVGADLSLIQTRTGAWDTRASLFP